MRLPSCPAILLRYSYFVAIHIFHLVTYLVHLLPDIEIIKSYTNVDIFSYHSLNNFLVEYCFDEGYCFNVYMDEGFVYLRTSIQPKTWNHICVLL